MKLRVELRAKEGADPGPDRASWHDTDDAARSEASFAGLQVAGLHPANHRENVSIREARELVRFERYTLEPKRSFTG